MQMIITINPYIFAFLIITPYSLSIFRDLKSAIKTQNLVFN
jgi:hypothetical protein